MDEDKLIAMYGDYIGKKVLLRKKSSPRFVVVGKLVGIIDTKLIIKGKDDQGTIDYEDLLSLDIKGKEQFEE